jgi:hypothetical protein
MNAAHAIILDEKVIAMPIHDWTRAPSGYFHHFHQRWSGTICDALNAGRLPKGIFALVEQYSGALVPDVLALETRPPRVGDWSGGRGGVALATDPPKTRFVSRAAEEAGYAAKANRIALYRDDETIAVIEIVSPGNKTSMLTLRQFVDKSIEFLERGIHLLVVDVFPPTPRDPQGIHNAIWGQISDDSLVLPADKPLTLAPYVAALRKTAYMEPVAVGHVLPDMPIFLDTQTYVRVPLEETYDIAWKGCPEEFRERVTGRQESVK